MIDKQRLVALAEKLKTIPHLNLTPYLPKVPIDSILSEISQFSDSDFQPYTNGLIRAEYLDQIRSKWKGLCLIEYCREGRHHIDYKTINEHNLTFHENNKCLPTDIGQLMPLTIDYLNSITNSPDRTRLLRLYPGGDATWHSHYHLAKSGISSIDGESFLDPVIQIPLITNNEVKMLVSKENPKINRNCRRYIKHYRPGDVWVFNSFHYHNAVNNGSTPRDHIMMYAKLDDEKIFNIIETAADRYQGDFVT